MTGEEVPTTIRVDDLKKVALDPDDVVVYTTERKLTEAEGQGIMRAHRYAFPNNRGVLFYDGVKVEVMREEPGGEAA
jgi:hypothetical protein